MRAYVITDHQQIEVNIEGHYFKELDHFKYLGVLICNKSCYEPKLAIRINLARRCMKQDLDLKIIIIADKNIQIYHKIIQPVLYGTETWILKKKKKKY